MTRINDISKLANGICQLVSQKFQNSVIPIILMWVKYKTITNNTLFDNSLPLDDEIELRGWGFQQ